MIKQVRLGKSILGMVFLLVLEEFWSSHLACKCLGEILCLGKVPLIFLALFRCKDLEDMTCFGSLMKGWFGLPNAEILLVYCSEGFINLPKHVISSRSLHLK